MPVAAVAAGSTVFISPVGVVAGAAGAVVAGSTVGAGGGVVGVGAAGASVLSQPANNPPKISVLASAKLVKRFMIAIPFVPRMCFEPRCVVCMRV